MTSRRDLANIGAFFHPGFATSYATRIFAMARNIERVFQCSRLATRLFLAAVFAITVALPWPASANGDDPSLNEFKTRLTELAKAHQGDVAFAVKHLASGEIVTFQADRAMPTASLIKLAIMIEAYRQIDEGELDLDTMITLREEDMVPGSGVLTSHFSAGTQLPLRDAIRLMMVFSDNTATNLVLNTIGLPATSKTMQSWGLEETKIHSLTFRRDTSVFPERSVKFGLGSTTAAETLQLLERISKQDLFAAELNQQMIDHMLACDDDTKIAADLPNGTKVANKTGAISNCRCDGAIIETSQGPLLVVVLTNNNQDQSWTNDNAAHRLCANIGRIAFDHYDDSNDTEDATSELRPGKTGLLVEALQRTLNERAEPSPELAVDGDFGPNTEQAVMNFQKQTSLPETGIVDRATWEALGTLLMSDENVPPPSEVNQVAIERESMDELAGLPFVTCKAWAIADAASGELLFENGAETSRDIASTTKIMTALIVLNWIESDASRLEEAITFSVNADETIGSTAGVRAGESTTVQELLYGLLLPSGNDASVAFAEHIGRSLILADSDSEDGNSPTGEQCYARFIDEMNRTAQRLGAHKTQFRNPHGLTEEGHQSSAADLVLIAKAALEFPLFSEIVNTPQRGAELSSTSGYTRNVVWKNTNRLLQIEGFAGVKTGTTRAAGACLVALSERDDRELLIVILGATSTDARYVDARNLARHAWNQIGETSQ